MFFRSVLSPFFKTLAVIFGLGIGFFALTTVSSFFGAALEPYIQTTAVTYRNMNGDQKMTGPLIARINIHGVIGMGDLRIEKVQALLDATQEGLFKGRTQALLLHINSPGGGAVDSNDIYNALVAYKKKYNIPVYAYADGLCASGAMMIACAADKIIASPTSIIGSVGVILSPNFNYTGLMGKVGITSETIAEGKNKDSFNPFRPWKENEGANLKLMASEMYTTFVDLVAKARPKLTVEKLKHEYGASIFIASSAVEKGYIDGLAATFSEAIGHFAKMGKFPEDNALIGPVIRHNIFEIFGSKKGGGFSIQHEIKGFDILSAELQGKPCFLYLPGSQ